MIWLPVQETTTKPGHNTKSTDLKVVKVNVGRQWWGVPAHLERKRTLQALPCYVLTVVSVTFHNTVH